MDQNHQSNGEPQLAPSKGEPQLAPSNGEPQLAPSKGEPQLAHQQGDLPVARTWGNIAFGVRLTRIDPAFFVSWSKLLVAGRQPGDVVLSPAVELPHSVALNFLAQQFLRSSCQSLLLLDDDMVFEPSDVATIRSTGAGFGILGGMAPCRRWPHLPIVIRRVPGRKMPCSIKNPSGLVEVDYIGLGFTLVSRACLEAVLLRNGNGVAFSWSNELGEDGLFCKTAQDLGFKVGCNADVSIGHRVAHTATWDVETQAPVMSFEEFGFAPIQHEEAKL